jgi:hypothetical protein
MFSLDHLLLYNKYVLHVYYFPITNGKIKQPIAMLTAVFFSENDQIHKKYI